MVCTGNGRDLAAAAAAEVAGGGEGNGGEGAADEAAPGPPVPRRATPGPGGDRPTGLALGVMLIHPAGSFSQRWPQESQIL